LRGKKSKDRNIKETNEINRKQMKIKKNAGKYEKKEKLS
jgi:hypothetical protein